MVKNNTYVPDRGDIVWLNFDPQAGHEQKGNHPAIVISPKAYNQKTGLALFCPVTSKVKNYPFEIQIAGNISGVILSDQIKSLDWKKRDAQYITKADQHIIKELQENLQLLIF